MLYKYKNCVFFRLSVARDESLRIYARRRGLIAVVRAEIKQIPDKGPPQIVQRFDLIQPCLVTIGLIFLRLNLHRAGALHVIIGMLENTAADSILGEGDRPV